MNRKTRGVIAAGHPATAEAGAEMFRQGGNAFDAVVAAAFASFVSELTLTSAGGGGFLTACVGKTGESLVLDFFVNMPGLGRPARSLQESFFPVRVDFGSTHQEFHVGAGSVAVPGNISGLCDAHQRYGSLPFESVLEPAVHLAREGVRITPHQAYFIKLLEPIRTLTAEGRKIVAPEGDLLDEGDLLFIKDFADSLELIGREGPSRYYTGDLAQKTVEVLEQTGGLLTLEDLQTYRVEARPPTSFNYRGYSILTNPPPSAGGGLIAFCLKTLEGIFLPEEDYTVSAFLNAQIAAMQLTNTVRVQGYDQQILDEKYCVLDFLAPERIQAYCYQLQQMLDGKTSTAEFADLTGGSGNTTQISVMDDKGNAASLTTSNGEGSGIFIPGTGIMLNNMLGEEDLHPTGFHGQRPGRRITSMMSPTIVLKNHEPVAVLGSGGSNRIRSAILQAVMNLIDFNKDIQESVNSPRIHWERGILNIEPGIHEEIADHLCASDHRIYWKETNLFFGGVHAVVRDPDSGALSGAGDHRRGGVAISVE